ncbi:hypothetical protein ACCS97_29565 [Rhizobium ruizarguesonis]
MGPATLFDKSFIEMLSVDQAAMFDLLFATVISPIFYVEVLADLEKDDPRTRTREKVVADVAKKTPVIHSYPNVSHLTLCLNELLGFPIEMRGFPMIHGGTPVMHKGQIALVKGQSAESKAFDRWQNERFHEVERDFAKDWRAALKDFDNGALATLTKKSLQIEESPKNHEHALEIAKDVLCRDGQHFLNLKLGYYFLGLDPSMWRAVEARWKAKGHQALPDYAPYFAHCLTVDIFFNLLMTKKIISPDRPSNRTDVAYLYYLPFCTLFVSEDRLHRRIAPLFMRDNQYMVQGAELKEDLIKLDTHFSALPEDVLKQGMFRVASTPPDDEAYLTTRLWKQCGLSTAPKPPLVKHESHAKIASQMKEVVALAKQPQRRSFSRSELKNPDQQLIRRLIPREWGKWTIIPPEVKGGEE